MSSADLAFRRGRGGFTLVELLVALVVSGILATVIFQLLQGQGKFVSIQSARAEVQQNSRGALELITSEIRSLPPGAIDSAAPDRIRYRLPRAWGIVCNLVGGVTGSASGTVGVVFPPGTFPPEFPTSFGQATGWGLAVPRAGGGYVTAPLTGASTAMGACAAALGASVTSGADVRQFSHNVLPAAVEAPPGTLVFVFQQVEYEVAHANSPRGYWIRRRSGAGNFEPLAGPLLSDGNSTTGLRFTYLCRTAAGGARQLTASELQAPASYRSVDRVRVRVQMQSRSLNRTAFDERTGQQQETDSLTVSLRNTWGIQPCP